MNSDVREILEKSILADGFDPIMDLDKSHGSWIVDQRNGDEYLDMFSMFASGAVGYNHPAIVKNEPLLGRIAVNKPTLSDMYNEEYAKFVETFNRIAVPEYLGKMFFIEGGALAVENALKVAFDWKRRKNMLAEKSADGSQIIHFKQAFHGRTGYTLSLTNTSDPRKTMYFPKFDWPRISNPYLKFPINDQVITDVISLEEQAIKEIKNSIKNNPDDIAGLIIEPIQGEGGDNHFRDEFFVSLRNICDENDILLIFDEVQTGIGITGKMWAHEHFSVKPDIISFGKKTQVCGLLAGDRIDEIENNVFVESSRINSTFGGNLIDMVRFKLVLEIIEKENLVQNAKNLGEYLVGRINTLSDDFPGFVTNPRGLGLFCAFDLPSKTERDKVCSKSMEEKLLILSSGDQAIRFRPHLNVSKEEIDRAFDTLYKVLSQILN